QTHVLEDRVTARIVQRSSISSSREALARRTTDNDVDVLNSSQFFETSAGQISYVRLDDAHTRTIEADRVTELRLHLHGKRGLPTRRLHAEVEPHGPREERPDNRSR